MNIVLTIVYRIEYLLWEIGEKLKLKDKPLFPIDIQCTYVLLLYFRKIGKQMESM